jgi:hypothetical protein
MKNIIYYILSLIEVPFIILAWVDYYWNLLWKNISNISIIFALPALLTMPITWIHTFTLAFIVYLKHNIAGIEITYEDAIRINLSRFPEL